MDELLDLRESQDIVEWLNSQLQLHATDEALRKLRLRLQVASEDLNLAINDNIQQLVHAVPIIQRESQNIASEAIALKQELQVISSKVNEVQKKNESITILGEIDTVKKRILHCRDVLAEVDNWKKRISFVQTYLNEKDFHTLLDPSGVEESEEEDHLTAEQVAEELASMEKSIQLLGSLPEFSGRQEELEELNMEFATRLLPHLIKSCEDHDQEIFFTCARTLQIIKKVNEIRETYIRSALTRIEQQADSYSERNVKYLDKWLQEFFQSRREFLQDELKWIEIVFTHEKEQVMKELLLKSFEEFRETFESWVNDFLKDKGVTSNDGLNILVQIYTATCVWFSEYPFSHYVKDLAVKTFWNIGSRTFILWLDKFHNFEILKLKAEWDHVRWIGENEKNKLTYQDIFQRIADTVQVIFPALEDSVQRCILLSGGGRVEQEIHVLSEFFGHMFDKLDMLMGRYQGEISSEDTFLQDQTGWVTEMHGAFKLLRAMNLVKAHLDSFFHFCIQEFTTSVTEVCTSDDVKNQTFKSLMDSKMFKNLVNYQDATTYTIFQAKILARWDVLRTGSEHLIMKIMMSKIEEALAKAWKLHCWSERKKRKKLETLNFADPSSYITDIANHIMTVAEHLSPPEDEDDPQKEAEFNQPYWTTRMVKGTSDAFLMMVSKIENLSISGSKQLATDVSFFVNVSSSLVQESETPQCFDSLEFLLKCELDDPTHKQFEFENLSEKRACDNIIKLRKLK